MCNKSKKIKILQFFFNLFKKIFIYIFTYVLNVYIAIGAKLTQGSYVHLGNILL